MKNCKIAYLILAHKNVQQLALLVESLIYEHNAIFIHIDKKSDLIRTQRLDLLKRMRNVKVISEYNIYWGSFNMVKATLRLLNIAFTEGQHDYYILLSGQDLPIKSNEFIEKFLLSRFGNNFIECWQLPAHDIWAGNGGLDRLSLFWFKGVLGDKFTKIIHTIQKKLGLRRKIKGVFYGGSSWFMLTRDCVEYILHASNISYLRRFKFTSNADEIYFQTLIMNSPHKEHVTKNNFRYICWKGQHNSPRILRQSDYESIVYSDKLFARKFDMDVDKGIFKKINEFRSKGT